MIKKIFIFVISILILGVAIYLIFTTVTNNQKKKIDQLEEKISLLQKENIPLRFKIIEKINDNIKVAVKYYDTEGKVIKRDVYEIKGSELHFDFVIIKAKSKEINIAFPYKIYSEKIAPDDGIKIAKSYDVKGFPQIFYSSNLDSDIETFFKETFQKVLTDEITAEDDYFGSEVHDINKYKNFKINTIYKIVTRIKGGIEIIEE